MNRPDNNKKKSGSLGSFFNGITSAIDDVVNEVKADLKAMTPPEPGKSGKSAEQMAKEAELSDLIGQSNFGLSETIVEDPRITAMTMKQESLSKSADAETKKTITTLPPGNLWQALVSDEYTTRLRADACYHALTQADVENYRRAIAAENAAPFTMGIAAMILQAPLEEELEEGGTFVADDLLLVSLLKAMEETRLYGAIGAGPRQIWPNFDKLDEALTTLLNTHPKLIALGPLGIDEPFAPYMLEQQKEQLAIQLDIAADFGLPVILSHRQSLKHMEDVLSRAEQLPELIWLDVLTSEEEFALVTRFNMSIVMRPEITAPDFPQSHMYRAIPAHKLLLGSGSALVAPHGFQGHFNQPKFLANSLTAASVILFDSERSILTATNKNLAALFQK
jgi:Tat protein secretion system quality control protein TatD with DNase activity